MGPQGNERRVAVIIEDDADIRNLLEAVLSQAGLEAIATSNGLDGISAVRAYDPVVTTLDVSMPGIDGFETAKRIRAFSSTYIVMLTARDDEIDTLQGLEAGADDYITKPFRPRELRARIDAMLRRPRQSVSDAPAEPVAATPPPAAAVPVVAPVSAPAPATPATAPAPDSTWPSAPVAPAAPAPAFANLRSFVATPVASTPGFRAAQSFVAAESAVTGDSWMEHNGLRLNQAQRLASVSGTPVALTGTEFDLLAALLDSPQRVHSLSDLALLGGGGRVTAYNVNEADIRAVEVNMGELSQKLGDSITTPRWVEIVRGVGYRLAARQNP